MMKSTKSYASALLSLCDDINSYEATIKELQLISSYLDNDFKKFLSYPNISKQEKKDIFTNSFKNISKLTICFIYVLIDNGAILNLDLIIDEMKQLVMLKKGIIKVTVETTKPLSNDEKIIIKQTLSTKLKKAIEIEEVVKADLIGGVILKYEGKVIDGSLFTKELSLKEYLKK